MPLDNAQFISELSITDPEGTDPLNQGDDQIRTTKRATQQSFPNINAPVPQTAAQMGQMAIKNEVNIFTQSQTFQQPLLAANGTGPLPAYSFTNEPGTGMRLVTPGILGWSVAGASLFSLSATRADWATVHNAPLGADGGAAYGFTAAINTGMSRGTGGALNFAVDGVRQVSMALSNFQVLVAATFSNFVTFSTIGARLFNFNNFIQKSGATQIAGFTYQDAAGIGRWLIGQSTANNSENYVFQRRDAAGTVQDTPMVLNNLNNQTRLLNLNMGRRVDTENSVIIAQTAGLVTRHSLNFEATGGFNPNSWTFSTFTSAGAFIGNLLRFGPNGELFMENLPTANPGGTNRLWKSSGFVAIT